MSRGDSYFARLKGTLDGVATNLRAKGIHERHLSFGGEGTVPERKPIVPTDARSEFIANRAMGDWAERMLRVRQQQRAAGKTTARETPSFTVKVEDLLIVYRWLEPEG